MRITIDTTNRIIEIESATTDELKQLCKDYKGFTIQSKMVNNYPYYTYPYSIPCDTTYTLGVTTTDVTCTSKTTLSTPTLN